MVLLMTVAVASIQAPHTSHRGEEWLACWQLPVQQAVLTKD